MKRSRLMDPNLRAPLRFARTSGEAFRDASYGACIERPWPTLWQRFMNLLRSL